MFHVDYATVKKNLYCTSAGHFEDWPFLQKKNSGCLKYRSFELL